MSRSACGPEPFYYTYLKSFLFHLVKLDAQLWNFYITNRSLNKCLCTHTSVIYIFSENFIIRQKHPHHLNSKSTHPKSDHLTTVPRTTGPVKLSRWPDAKNITFGHYSVQKCRPSLSHPLKDMNRERFPCNKLRQLSAHNLINVYARQDVYAPFARFNYLMVLCEVSMWCQLRANRVFYLMGKARGCVSIGLLVALLLGGVCWVSLLVL